MRNSSRFGSSLSHGQAHIADHQRWNRRDFLSQVSLGGLAASFLMGRQPVKAYASHPLLNTLNQDGERILVLIQLNGGNDGLNTVIPLESQRYLDVRPNIAIPASEAIGIDSSFGLHPNLNGLESVWGDGRLGIVHSAGYPDPNLSHFRSTDIWATASDSDEYLNTGWLGRHFDQAYPGYAESPPAHPLAVQLGQASSFMLQGPVGPMGMNIANQNILERLANGGQLYDESGVPATKYGDELSFARAIANDAYHYAGVIYESLQTGTNQTEYPAPNPLATDLASVARMIKGGLPTRLYLVSLGGFDTHANQLTRHETLMRNLGGAMKAFQDDLAASGHSEAVMTMTFSEFGRRVEENGSRGTDHGTAAPLFVMGDGVAGGFYGQPANLDALDDKGNLAFNIDFRSVYATLLEHWMGYESAQVDHVLGQPFNRLGFVAGGGSSVANESDENTGFRLHQNYPNPALVETTFAFTLPQAQRVRLIIYDITGRAVDVATDQVFVRGQHAVPFQTKSLASGTYLYRIETEGFSATRQMTVVR